MTKEEIEGKYEIQIGKLIKRMKNKTMRELWIELDKLKEKMRNEFEREGIRIES